MLKDEMTSRQLLIHRRDWDYRTDYFDGLAADQYRLDGDSSLMTYSGHQVLQTLIRARFSPLHTTGQRYIYSGSYDGNVYSKNERDRGGIDSQFPEIFIKHVLVWDILTGKLINTLEAHVRLVG
jgi:hypothetical protein